MRMIVAMLGFFIIAQLLGIYTGVVVLSDINRNPYISELIITTDAEEPLNAVVFILYILTGALLMLVLIRLFQDYPVIFRIMEFVLIATASSIVFYAFLRIFAGYDISTLMAVVLGIVFSGTRLVIHGLKNTAAIMATAGVGVIFGISLGMFPLILFLLMLSVYDYLSVFATKHMVELANFVVKRDLAFTVTARRPPTKPGEKEGRIDLGTGDIIAPIMLEVSALSFNPVASVFVFVGAVISMGIFLSMVWGKRMVLPALPPIVLGMVSSLALGFLLGFY